MVCISLPENKIDRALSRKHCNKPDLISKGTCYGVGEKNMYSGDMCVVGMCAGCPNIKNGLSRMCREASISSTSYHYRKLRTLRNAGRAFLFFPMVDLEKRTGEEM